MVFNNKPIEKADPRDEKDAGPDHVGERLPPRIR
jgi:hypothetical protein